MPIQRYITPSIDWLGLLESEMTPEEKKAMLGRVYSPESLMSTKELPNDDRPNSGVTPGHSTPSDTMIDASGRERRAGDSYFFRQHEEWEQSKEAFFRDPKVAAEIQERVQAEVARRLNLRRGQNNLTFTPRSEAATVTPWPFLWLPKTEMLLAIGEVAMTRKGNCDSGPWVEIILKSGHGYSAEIDDWPLIQAALSPPVIVYKQPIDVNKNLWPDFSETFAKKPDELTIAAEHWLRDAKHIIEMMPQLKTVHLTTWPDCVYDRGGNSGHKASLCWPDGKRKFVALVDGENIAETVLRAEWPNIVFTLPEAP